MTEAKYKVNNKHLGIRSNKKVKSGAEGDVETCQGLSPPSFPRAWQDDTSGHREVYFAQS
jgi:hypothetical protein